MGLVAAICINAAYWVELHFLIRFVRSLLNARKRYLFLTIFVVLALVALGLNLFIFIGIFTLLGFDTDFVGAAFVFMLSGFISLIVLLFIFVREIWSIYH